MKQYSLMITTNGRGFYDITQDISARIKEADLEIGLCHVFLHHTSASLCLCENADPQVQQDLEAFMSRYIPDGDPLFKHTSEGPDDMPAHVRTILTQSFLTLPISNNKLALGQWQSVYLWEHRFAPYQRRITLTLCS